MIEIDRQPERMLGEARREHVCTLFVDVSGFTRLAQTAEPETLYLTVRPLLDRLVEVVVAHTGRIQQVLGDGFMAAFGLDGRLDAVGDAICAGIDLVTAADACGAGLPVHVGIEFGQVLVTPSWEPASFGIWGHSVNLAKRLCDLARPSEIQVGPSAFARVRHRLSSLTSDLVTCKNIAGDVIAHRLVSDRLPSRGRRGSANWTCSRLSSAAARGPKTSPAPAVSSRTVLAGAG